MDYRLQIVNTSEPILDYAQRRGEKEMGGQYQNVITQQEKWIKKPHTQQWDFFSYGLNNVRQQPRPLTAISNYEQLEQMIIST